MKVNDTIKNAFIIHKLIEQKKTGNDKSISKRIGIAIRHVSHYIEALSYAEEKRCIYDEKIESYVYIDQKPEDGHN